MQQSRKPTEKSWMVQQWLVKDHMLNHYRKLSQARSCINLSQQRNPVVRYRNPSNSLVESKLRDLEHRISSSWSVSAATTAVGGPNAQKTDTFDPRNDLLCTHSRYFSKPEVPFTPKTLRKVVAEHQVKQASSFSKRTSRSSSARPTVRINLSPPSATYCQSKESKSSKKFTGNQRTLSGDSAFSEANCSDGHLATARNLNDDIQGRQFQKWLEQQEEESRYLKLLCEVTADLLQRGLCNNEAVKRIIADYVQKNCHRFSIKPDALMERLVQDLDVPSSTEFDSELYASGRGSGLPLPILARNFYDIQHNREVQEAQEFELKPLAEERPNDSNRGESTRCEEHEEYDEFFDNDSEDEIPEILNSDH